MSTARRDEIPIASLTLEVTEDGIKLTGLAFEGSAHAGTVPATSAAERIGDKNIRAGTAIFLLGGRKNVWLRADRPPWPTTGWHVYLSQNVRKKHSSHETPPLVSVAFDARLKAWAMMQLARCGVAEDTLFRRGRGNRFSLVPGPPPGQSRKTSTSLVPFQLVHHSAFAITPELANRRCNNMNEAALLTALNDIFGTRRPMEPSLSRCMKYLLRAFPDLGSVYGVVRPYWTSDLGVLPDALARRQANDMAMRKDVVADGYLKDANIPPRRVWDLYSNRVLPYHVLPPPAKGNFPDRLWPVSHSWQDADKRTLVSTPINGGAWPVPIPRTTTLENVRVELLNLGAEYVWLDVLCLRQVGKDKDEPQRRDEWKLDIPTIGYIYAIPDVPCITYFNGLGLPFDPSREARRSPCHWLQRVWTIQESTPEWLHAGMTAADSADAAGFFHEQHVRAIAPRFKGNESGDRDWLRSIARMLVERHATTELDKVSSFPYLLGCKTRPVYDAAVPPALAWAGLLKHLPPRQRAQISLSHIERRPAARTILPTWREFLEDFSAPAEPEDLTHWRRGWPSLELAPWSRLGAAEPGQYLDRSLYAGPFVITRQTPHSDGATIRVARSSNGSRGARAGEEHRLAGVLGGPFEEGAQCFLRRIRRNILVVLQIVGRRTVDAKPAFVVKRCGVAYMHDAALQVREWDPIFADETNICVVYVPDGKPTTRV
ncbi:hypothetical protein PsYK624_153080 [Phanerochaete sordida]|uniref:Heterokaryon incompatibility domain-containing protein n=1 Tax=Phanerochaete sordida TaxID=48140 RepID=A0A9P3GPA7_9APHY|nr:hypothetical protein PsYK624_153080 [Phanerochaete sordida]